MSELTKRASLLRAQIEQAFADVPYPGDENLYDGGQRDSDYADVIRNLTGKHWRDLIPKRKPPQGRSTRLSKDMIFCSAAAWHFFLPAYLIGEIMRGEISPSLFDPERSEGLRNHIERGFSRLNAEQCAVVAAFLGYGDALFVEKMKKMPQYATYYEKRRQQFASVIAYWNNRARITTRMGKGSI